jgi:hypothetical protein
MEHKRAQIYVGSHDFILRDGMIRLYDESNRFGRMHLISPGIQEIWEHYQLVIDGKLVTSMHYLPYNPYDDETLWKYRDAGGHIAIEMHQRGLGINDFEIINGKMIDLETNAVKQEVEVEIQKVETLRASLLSRLKKHERVGV